MNEIYVHTRLKFVQGSQVIFLVIKQSSVTYTQRCAKCCQLIRNVCTSIKVDRLLDQF